MNFLMITLIYQNGVNFPALISLCFTNIPVAKGISGNTGFAHGQKDDDDTEKHQNKSSSEVASHGCDNRDKELANWGGFLVSDVVSGPSSLNVEAQCHPEHGQFVSPVCGKGFRRKIIFLYINSIIRERRPLVALAEEKDSLRNIN
ncbi:hypothetical protein AVEN_242505-1 [Araneus ventricosus]|uniref:Uncharacterized protein n=1 Tax=Araneus ventricosus TaxID=182803 RepID=A0A4Y2CLR2_ARAVE|nr:hypothetical protein AVEN_242505-1 [Araneus ventricosus]